MTETGSLPLRRTAIATLIVWIAAFGLIGCEQDQQSALLDVEYADWSRTVENDITIQVPGHGDSLRRIFINETGAGAQISPNGGITYPDGTIIVKEVYGSREPGQDEEPVSLTGMVKASDHPEARGGWIWVVRNVTSGEEQILAQEFCVTCHANANESHPYGDGNPNGVFRDYVFYRIDQQQ